MAKDINMKTGYCTHRLYSNENRIIVVPLEYSHIAEEVAEGLNPNELNALGKDLDYINECIILSAKDILCKNGLEKKNAINNKKFFEKILESLVK
jgi:hypothetical protein